MLQDPEITDEFDQEFLNLLVESEKQTVKLNRHDQLRVKSWCKKLCQITNNVEWKKNRNLHAICILDNIINERFEDPYNKFAPESPVPIINKTVVKAKLSQKFLKSTINLKNQVPLKQNNNYNKLESSQSEREQSKENNREIEEKTMKSDRNTESEAANMQIKEIICKLQKEGIIKDKLIKKLKDDKMKMEKRIQELERMISNFMLLEKK